MSCHLCPCHSRSFHQPRIILVIQPIILLLSTCPINVKRPLFSIIPSGSITSHPFGCKFHSSLIINFVHQPHHLHIRFFHSSYIVYSPSIFCCHRASHVLHMPYALIIYFLAVIPSFWELGSSTHIACLLLLQPPILNSWIIWLNDEFLTI